MELSETVVSHSQHSGKHAIRIDISIVKEGRLAAEIFCATQSQINIANVYAQNLFIYASFDECNSMCFFKYKKKPDIKYTKRDYYAQFQVAK